MEILKGGLCGFVFMLGIMFPAVIYFLVIQAYSHSGEGIIKFLTDNLFILVFLIIINFEMLAIPIRYFRSHSEEEKQKSIYKEHDDRILGALNSTNSEREE